MKGRYMLTLNINPSELDKRYIVYHVQDENELLFIGHDNIANIIGFTAFKRFSDFNRNKMYKIFIYDGFDNRVDATKEVYKLVNTLAGGHIPKYNKIDILRYNKAVIRLSDGMRFENARKAGEFMGVDSGRMSYHLQRKQGYRTIKGEIFEYENSL